MKQELVESIIIANHVTVNIQLPHAAAEIEIQWEESLFLIISY